MGSGKCFVTFVAEVPPYLVVDRHHMPLQLVGRVERLGALVADVVVRLLVDVLDAPVQPVLLDEGGGALVATEPLLLPLDPPQVVAEPR